MDEMTTSKPFGLPFTLLLLFALLPGMSSALMAETIIKRNNPEVRTNASFAGCRALVLKSDLAWNAWDSTMYGALQRKGMAVVWEEGAMADTRDENERDARNELLIAERQDFNVERFAPGIAC